MCVDLSEVELWDLGHIMGLRHILEFVVKSDEGYIGT